MISEEKPDSHKKRISIIADTLKEHPEYIYYISPIDEINSHKIIDSSTRYGYYILAI